MNFLLGAATEAPEGLDVASMVIGLLGGLALFLFGLDQMTTGFKAVAGEGLRKLLAKLTTNRFSGALTGAFVTALLQSSSVTTVLLVGFVSAGLMTLSQSVGVIMGANIGSTVTAQIIAFKVTKYALIAVTLGFAMSFVGRHDKIKQYGAMVMGLGLVFFGMNMMSDATRPLRDYQPFIDLMQQMKNPLWGILIALVFTGLVQSSAATTGIVIVLATQGLVTLENGIALAFGANIGTCVTALLASIGKPREAVRAAAVHIMFNVLGVLLWVGFIDHLALFVRWISPVSAELEGVEALAADTPRQIANAHTVFNVANTVLFIWFTTPLALLAQKLIPSKPVVEAERIKPQFIDDMYLETPDMALELTRRELARLGDLVLDMLRKAPPIVMAGKADELAAVEQMDEDVDLLYGDIVAHLAELSQVELTSHETALMADLTSISNHIEDIGDTVETNMVSLGRERLRQQFQISDMTRQKFRPFFDEVTRSLELSIKAMLDDDEAAAQEVLEMKGQIRDLADDMSEHLRQRLRSPEGNRVAAFSIETDMAENLKRVYYFAKRIAKRIARAEDLERDEQTPTVV